MQTTNHFLLSLLRGTLTDIPRGTDWPALFQLSTEQGVAALVVDALQRFMKDHPDVQPFAEETAREKMLRMQWISSAVTYEKLYARHEKRMADLANVLADGGFRMMVLKGYGLSLCWPQPNHRPVGDLDIYNFGTQKEADAFIAQRCGIKVDEGHEHHTVYAFNGIPVENHYDFINVRAHRDAPAIEARLKALASEGCKEVEVQGTTIYLPSANFNAIFLMRHMAQHFAGERVTLRQVLDWGFYMQRFTAEVDWPSTLAFLEEIGLLTFFHQINAICVDHLGIAESSFPPIVRNEALETRILRDIFQPEFGEEEPSSGLLPILAFKFRRWWCNRWKHRLVYDDNLFMTFITLAWSHIR